VGGELDTATLLNSLNETVPLSKTMSEQLSRLRQLGAGPGAPASGAIVTGSTESPPEDRVVTAVHERGAKP